MRTLPGLAAAATLASAKAAAGWPQWDEFQRRFVQADGRVIDLTFERKSTSEGQSYALFFALVADQRAPFERVLRWTSENLAAGQLGQRLPAWHWGLRDDGHWGVKDPNSASDADLWIAYALLEAARLWQAPHYAETAHQLLAQIRQYEVIRAGAAGLVLLPGAFGFQLARGRVRLNPSYLPGFMFRYLARADPPGPWQAVWDGFERMAPRAFGAGVAPDLFVVDAAGQVLPDSEAEPSASYDAIRVYLWAGMSGAASLPLVKLLAPYGALTRRLGRPPEKVDPRTGVAVVSAFSPIGFSGAMLPFLAALGDADALRVQGQRIQASALATRRDATNYYDEALLLFGTGWHEGRYRFDDQGRLVPRWAGATTRQRSSGLPGIALNQPAVVRRA